MRILFVSVTLGGGGAERFVSTSLAHLDRTRFEPELCLFRRDLSYPLPEDVPLTVVHKSRPWHIPTAILGLARTIDRVEPDVVFSAFSHPNFMVGNAMALCSHRCRWVARVSNDPEREESGWQRPWMRVLYRRADRVLANSIGLRDAFEARHPAVREGIHYLPNATDVARIERLAREPIEREERPGASLIAVGRLTRQKRIDVLIDALSALPSEIGAELTLCGEGPLRRPLERQVAALGLGDRVHFEGFRTNPYPWMAGSDLFLLGSDWEGLPNALIEAQVLGVPVVATECRYGPGEIVAPEETGLLVPPGDPAAMAAAIRRLLSNPARLRQMGEAARERARGRYAAEPIVRELEAHLLGDRAG